MATTNTEKAQSIAIPTVDPKALCTLDDLQPGPFPSRRFNSEEWENWMQWDGAMASLSPHSGSDQSSPGLQGDSVSHESTSPSETESIPIPPSTPIYQIPSISFGQKSPPPTLDTRRQINRKRKPAASNDRQEIRTRQPKGQKISHNVIEKRYRTNLNDKIARLRDSVPVLKTAFEVTQRQAAKEGESASDDSGSEEKTVTSGVKFNKATVLTKATEYIEQLEKANAKLLSENSTLRKRVKNHSNDTSGPKPLYFSADEANTSGSSLPNQVKFETISTESLIPPTSPAFISGKIPVAAAFQRLRAEATDGPSYAPVAPAAEPLSPSRTPQESETALTTSGDVNARGDLIDFDSVQGSIPLPDYLRRNRVPISRQEHYAPMAPPNRADRSASDTFTMDDEEPSPWWPRNRASKLLLGSLAGLMIMEGLNAGADRPQKTGLPSKTPLHAKRSLISLPDDFYTESRGFRAQIRQRIIDFSHSPHGKKALPILMLSAVILSVVFLALVYLSRNDPRARRRANSVSSNPEGGNFDPPSTKSDHNQSLDLGTGGSAVLQRIQGHDFIEIQAPLNSQRQVFDEVLARIQACWRIIKEGDQSSYLVTQRHGCTRGNLQVNTGNQGTN